jgi:hypothetical protein
MATILTPSHPSLSLCLPPFVAQTVSHVSVCSAPLPVTSAARRSLVREYVLSLAARLPVAEASHAY